MLYVSMLLLIYVHSIAANVTNNHGEGEGGIKTTFSVYNSKLK